MPTSKNVLLLLFFFIFSGCQFWNQDTQHLSYDSIELKNQTFSLYFSHNINGETHPCGCHQFPRGGLAPLKGLFHQLKRPDQDSLYLDTGDTFFPSSVLPKNREQSLLYTAQTLAEALDQLHLRYLTPGDQDFAMDTVTLSSLVADKKFRFLISNLSHADHLKHKKWVLLHQGKVKIFLVGLVDPSVLPQRYAHLFVSPEQGLNKVLPELIEHGYDPQNPHHQLIVLSHAGMTADRQLAKSFPQIDWIIGAHSSSYTQTPNKEGKTTLVQVLSRNHFLGEVRFHFRDQGVGSQFVMHEIKDHLDKVLDPNPMSELVARYLERLAEIQKEEQALVTAQTERPLHPFNTAQSCLECHTEQYDFWEKQRHSLAYLTLVRANQEFDLNCIQCHSLGAQHIQGFQTVEEMVILDPKKAHENGRQAYWSEFREAFKNPPLLSQTTPKGIQELRKKWKSIDERHGVTHQFANVQCLNCHDQHQDHPFHISDEPKPTPEQRRLSIQNKCLACHNSDQSPSWYTLQDDELRGELDLPVFEQVYKKMSCPSLEELD